MTDALNDDFRIGRLGRIALELFRKIETHSFFKLSLLVEAFSAEIIITIVLTSTSSTLVMTGTVISIFCLSLLSPEMYLKSFQNMELCSSLDLSLVTKLMTPNRDQSLSDSVSSMGAITTELVVQAQYFRGYLLASNP